MDDHTLLSLGRSRRCVNLSRCDRNAGRHHAKQTPRYCPANASIPEFFGCLEDHVDVLISDPDAWDEFSDDQLLDLVHEIGFDTTRDALRYESGQ